MQRRLVLILPAVAGCTNWSSLYGDRPADAAAMTSDGPVAEPVPMDGLAPMTDERSAATDGATIEAPACAATGPLVLWRFDGHGPPSPMGFIPDSACRPPDVSLAWDLERNAGKTELANGALFLDGGFLFAEKPVSDELGRQLMRAKSFAIELWLRGMRTESGTIFATNGEHDPGRAFSIAQKDGALHFAVRTTATDPNGERFAGAAPPSGSAELVVPFPIDPKVPLHVVAMYSGPEHAAALYLNGVRMETIVHAHPGAPDPAPVWAAAGKNQLGLGGTFDGAAWHGWLHLVAVYDRALTADEVLELYQLGPTR